MRVALYTRVSTKDKEKGEDGQPKATPDNWSPRTIAQLNGSDVMVVKVKGEFVWHKHDETDDFFFVGLSLPARAVHGVSGAEFVLAFAIAHHRHPIRRPGPQVSDDHS
jgi:hypothetical protein